MPDTTRNSGEKSHKNIKGLKNPFVFFKKSVFFGSKISPFTFPVVLLVGSVYYIGKWKQSWKILFCYLRSGKDDIIESEVTESNLLVILEQIFTYL